MPARSRCSGRGKATPDIRPPSEEIDTSPISLCVMAGLGPRLSGSPIMPKVNALGMILHRQFLWYGGISTQFGERSAMHDVCPHQTGELRAAVDYPLLIMGQPDQHKRDQRHRDLNAHRVLRRAVEVPHLQSLFDPAEEQLDRPAALVECCDLPGWCIQIVSQDAQHRPGFSRDLDLAHRVIHRVTAAVGQTRRQEPDLVGHDGLCLGRHRQGLNHLQRRIRLLSRVTIRQAASSSFVHQPKS